MGTVTWVLQGTTEDGTHHLSRRRILCLADNFGLPQKVALIAVRLLRPILTVYQHLSS